MHITYAPKGILQIDGARIAWRNFAGKKKMYNDEGDRNFILVIPDEKTADELTERGWNVRVNPPRDENDSPFIYLKVKIGYYDNGRGPAAYLVTNDRQTELNADTIGILDNIDIMSVDLDIRPHDWNRPDGRSGRSAWLQAIRVTQKVDRFARDNFGNDEEGLPFN